MPVYVRIGLTKMDEKQNDMSAWSVDYIKYDNCYVSPDISYNPIVQDVYEGLTDPNRAVWVKLGEDLLKSQREAHPSTMRTPDKSRKRERKPREHKCVRTPDLTLMPLVMAATVIRIRNIVTSPNKDGREIERLKEAQHELQEQASVAYVRWRTYQVLVHFRHLNGKQA